MRLLPPQFSVIASRFPLRASLIVLSGCTASIAPPARTLTEFESRLESLRAGARIPAVSAAITSTDRVAWTKGFGTADITANRAASDTTVYHLASLTKPFAAAIILQYVREGKVSLDEPVSSFGVILPGAGGVVRVRHLMSHTSSGIPGTVYRYDGSRFGLLDSVISHVSGKRFADVLQERIVQPLGLQHTAPNPQAPAFAVSGHDRAAFERNFAHGYTATGMSYAATPYPSYFGTAAGLTASVIDVARFSLALDANVLLDSATKALAFAPTVGTSGDTLPYGLGWFSTRYRGMRVVWHYGLWTAISSLIIKVPERGLTFVLLANTDALSAPYPLGQGKLESSPWARAFLDAFVFGEATLPSP